MTYSKLIHHTLASHRKTDSTDSTGAVSSEYLCLCVFSSFYYFHVLGLRALHIKLASVSFRAHVNILYHSCIVWAIRRLMGMCMKDDDGVHVGGEHERRDVR